MVRLVGGDLSVDLVNTIDLDIAESDQIATPAGLAAWLEQVGLEGPASVTAARRARTAIDAVLRPLADGAAPQPQALDALRRLERAALGRAELHPEGWRFPDPVDAIVHAAVELLHHGRADRLKRCDNCPWLYLDLSRNNSRRWCSMEGCGTQVKVARLTERRRATR